MQTRTLIISSLTVLLAAFSLAPAPWAGGTPPKVSDETSYDVLTYSAWGRQNNLSGAQCTGFGAAGHVFLGATHASFRCQVQIGGAPAGTVVAKAIGPESFRVTSVSGGKLKPDRGIGNVPVGKPTFKNFDAVDALQKAAWAKQHKVTRVLCFGVGSYRLTSTSSYFFAFSCATFNSHDMRGQQVLVTAAGAGKVRVVRTIAK